MVRYDKTGGVYVQPKKPCKIKTCNKITRIKRGWCTTHYQRWAKWGDPMNTKVVYEHPTTCTKTGCNNEYSAKGLCKSHYMAARPEKRLEANAKYLTKLGKKLHVDTKIVTYVLLAWGKVIKKLDVYTCVNCGSKKDLHAHHIYPKMDFPSKAFDYNNGITLCNKCHEETHGFKFTDNFSEI